MQSYYDSLVAELIGGGMPLKNNYLGKRLSPGAGIGITDEDIEQAAGSGMSPQDARRFASEAENEWLRGSMRTERKRTKNDRLPEGSYAQAMYPGLEYDVWAAKRGLAPRGAGAGAAIIPGSDVDDMLEKLRRSWGINQGAMIPGGNFVSRMGGR